MLDFVARVRLQEPAFLARMLGYQFKQLGIQAYEIKQMCCSHIVSDRIKLLLDRVRGFRVPCGREIFLKPSHLLCQILNLGLELRQRRRLLLEDRHLFQILLDLIQLSESLQNREVRE